MHIFHQGEPLTSLAIDASGSLYGATPNGGASGQGVVFKLTPSEGGWIYTELHHFPDGNGDGTVPNGVTLDASGNLFGTTRSGGTAGGGIIFEILP